MNTQIAAFVVVLAIVTPHRAGAQDAPPCAQPILEQIRFLEGSWTVQARSRLSANPTDWESSTGAATIESGMRRCAFIERYRGTRRGRVFEAIRVFTATAAGAGLRLSIADSEHGPLFSYDGGPETDVVAFHTQVTTPNGQVRLRITMSDIRQDSFVTESHRSTDEGRTWDLTGRSEYRRARSG